MKKLLVVCDEFVYKHNGHYYAGSNDKFCLFQHYLRAFDVVRFALRCVDEADLKEGRVLLEGDNIEIYPLPEFHGPKQYFLKYLKLGRLCKKSYLGCDAAILRIPSTVAQRVAPFIIKQRIPYAVEVVFDAHDGAKSAESIIEKLLWFVIDKQMLKICSNADGVAPVTEKYLQKRYYSQKSDCFSSHYSSINLTKEFYSSFREFPQKDIFTIAHIDAQIGLHSRKGTFELINATKILKDRGVIVNVELAGDDWDNSTKRILDYTNRLGLRNQIKCIGFLSRTQLSEFLDRADIFVLPTKAEGLPRVIIEAIAKGLPCITTPVSGNPELISGDYLVDYSDIEGLANKIEILIKNKKEYERVSRENYERSLQYEASLLEERRLIFYNKLKERAKMHN